MRFVVGYPPGGATDIIARLIGQRLSERLGQQFVIENKPGAGNNIGTEAVVNAEPDGYTVLLVNPANYINTSLYANLKFNFVRDIAPVASFNRVPNVMTVAKDVPAKNGRRVHRLCEGQSGQGEHGLVRQRHLGASVRRNVHGDDRRQDAARALSRRGARDHRSARRPGAGDLRQHAVDHPAHPLRRAARAGGDDGGARRRNCPDVPTVAETVPGYEASALFGMGAPKNTPKEIIDKLNSEINAILAEPDMKKRLVELGGEPLIQTPEAFGAMIVAETEKWKKVVEFAGLKVE